MSPKSKGNSLLSPKSKRTQRAHLSKVSFIISITWFCCNVCFTKKKGVERYHYPHKTSRSHVCLGCFLVRFFIKTFRFLNISKAWSGHLKGLAVGLSHIDPNFTGEVINKKHYESWFPSGNNLWGIPKDSCWRNLIYCGCVMNLRNKIWSTYP